MISVPQASDRPISFQASSFKKAGVFLALASFILILFGMHTCFSNWPRIWDISLWDESFYMKDGIYNWTGNFRQYEWSPLYSYIYRVAHHWVESPVALFNTVGLIDVVGAMLVLYFAVWRISGNLFLATTIVCGLALSNFPMIQPRSIYPTIIILALGAATAFSMRSLMTRVVVLAMAAFLATFIRPEFALSFYLFTLTAIGATLLAVIKPAYRALLLPQSGREATVTFAAVVAVVLLCFMWTFPIVHGGDRALNAFGQHYAAYWAQVNHGDSFVWFDFHSVFDKEFPGVHSEFQALAQSPKKVLDFLAFNVTSMFQNIWQTSQMMVKEHAVFVATAAVALVAAIVMAIRAYRNARTMPIVTADGTREPWFIDAALWLMLAVPNMISIVLIYAEGHYLVVLTAMCVLGVAIIARHVRFAPHPAFALLMAAVFVFSVHPAPDVPRPKLDILQALDKQPYMGHMLDLDGGWCLYTPDKCTPRFVVFNIHENMDFLEYIRQENIQSIVITDWSVRIAQMEKQQAFLDFLAHAEQSGWQKVQLNPETYLLRHVADSINYVGSAKIVTPIQLVDHIEFGDKLGAVRQRNDMTLFVHPGMTTPTSFDLKLGQLARTTGCHRILLTGNIDPDIPKEVVGKAGGRVGMTVARGGSVLFSQTVTEQDQAKLSIAPNDNDVVNVKIDNHGNADHDWFNLSFDLADCRASTN